MEPYNASIISAMGKGYKLQTPNRQLLISILSQYESDVIVSREERLHLLTMKLLVTTEGVELYDLEDEFYVSRSTLMRDIKHIKSMLANLFPALDVNIDGGRVRILGPEVSIRFSLNELVMLKYDIRQHRFSLPSGYIDQDEFNKIMKEIIQLVSEYDIILTDKGIASTAAYLTIARKRLQGGYFIVAREQVDSSLDDDVYQIATCLFENTIEKEVSISNMNRNMEIAQIAAQLSFINLFSSSSYTKTELNQHTPEYVISIVRSLITYIKNDFNIDLTHDEELYIGLTLHISALINRLKYHQINNSPILDTIKGQYPFIFELSLHIYEIFKNVLSLKLTESELSYVAAHIAAAIERLGLEHAQDKIKVALISHMSNSYSQLLLSKLRSIYGDNVTIVGPYPMYKLTDIMEQKPSAILTTIYMFSQLNFDKGIPVLPISPFFDQNDKHEFDKLLEVIRKDMTYFHKEQTKKDIIDKFDENLFFPRLDCCTLDETINFLCDSLEEQGVVSPEFRKLTFEREQLASTALANSIAIPHPIKACSYRTVVAVAALKKAIPWGNQKAQLIFLLAVRQSEKQYIKSFFGFVDWLMDNNSMVQCILKSKDFIDFRSYIKSYIESTMQQEAKK